MKLPKSLERNVFSFLSRWVAPGLLRGIRLSCSLSALNRQHLEELYPENNFILAFWHGQMLPLLHYFLNSGFYTFASPHRDGEYIARILDGMGQNSLRTSLRDVQVSALVKGLKLARSGETLVVTPDGPLGPRMQAREGIIKISQRTELPILPAAGLATRAYFFSSWDRFCFPLPFSQIILNFGQPLYPWKKELDSPEAAGRLEKKLTELTGRLTRDCPVPDDYFTPEG